MVSGKEIMSLELSDGLVERGQSVSFVTSFWNNGDFPSRLKQRGLPICTLPIGFISATLSWRCIDMTMEQIKRWPGLLWNYSRLLRRLNPCKVVHTNWHHVLLLLPLLRPDCDVYWLHEVVPNLAQYRRVFHLIERRVGAFICVSEATAAALRAIGIRDDKIRVIRNGLTDPADPHNSARTPSQQLRFGIIGQVNPWKGHLDLLEAFAPISRKHRNTELHIFGKGNADYKSELIQKSAALGVVDRLCWHDYVTDRSAIYRNLDVCVVPSLSADPFPTTALEAGFFGLPAVVTRRGGLPEIIEHEVNGLVVEAERPQELAAALCRLAEDPALRHRLGQNARNRAVEQFGRKRFVDEFQRVLQLQDAI